MITTLEQSFNTPKMQTFDEMVDIELRSAGKMIKTTTLLRAGGIAPIACSLLSVLSSPLSWTSLQRPTHKRSPSRLTRPISGRAHSSAALAIHLRNSPVSSFISPLPRDRRKARTWEWLRGSDQTRRFALRACVREERLKKIGRAHV